MSIQDLPMPRPTGTELLSGVQTRKNKYQSKQICKSPDEVDGSNMIPANAVVLPGQHNICPEQSLWLVCRIVVCSVTSTRSCKTMTVLLTTRISDDNFAHQSPLPSLNLSSRRSNLSRALSPEHASESAGSRLGGPNLAPSRIGYSFYIIYI